MEKIGIGTLDTLVLVQSATRSTGAQGQKTTTYADFREVYAKVERSSSESVGDYNVESGQSLTLTMYKIPEMTTRWRIKVAGKPYEISAIDDVKRTSLFCTVSLRAIDG